jgi:methionyl aminopeptidase
MLKVTDSKTADMLAHMRQAAAIAIEVLETIGAHVRPGTSTAAIDRVCHDLIVARGGVPACVGYLGYRHATCISVNQVVCHGIPDERLLKDGDLLNVDVVVECGGMHADTSAMFVAGTPSIRASRLSRVTQECLYLGILEVKPGATIGDVGAAIQAHASANGCSVVRDFCGHGIGAAMHESPEVPHFGRRGSGVRLMPGMTFTIEPMLNAGGSGVRLQDDGWTVVTRDRSLSAQWEHTVLVTSEGCEILTLRPGEVAGWNAFRAGR